jgi:hypothetical protein
MAVETDMELTPIWIEEIMRDRAMKNLLRRLRNKTSARSLFYIDERGILARVAPLNGVRQIVIPAALITPLLHLEHCQRTVAHPGVIMMLRKIRRTEFWPNMAEDVL